MILLETSIIILIPSSCKFLASVVVALSSFKTHGIEGIPGKSV